MAELPKYAYFRFHPEKHGTAVEIEDASDVDVVEVVRCKDCIHADEYRHCDKVAFWNMENDFCSRGVRREE